MLNQIEKEFQKFCETISKSEKERNPRVQKYIEKLWRLLQIGKLNSPNESLKQKQTKIK